MSARLLEQDIRHHATNTFHNSYNRSRPIRVCFVIDNLSRAGTESQLLALIRAIDRNRFTPSLILLNGHGAESRALEPANCQVVRLGVTRLMSIRAARAAMSLRQHWKAHRPDIVQAYFLDSSYFVIPLARALGVRRILRVRNNLGYWQTMRHRVLQRLIQPVIDYSLTNSEAGREVLIARDGLAPERVIAIENGVDLDRFAGCEAPRFGPTVRVGCVANLRPVKNVDGLLRAAQSVLSTFPNVVFEVAGEGEQRRELERLRDELGIADRFKLCGSVSDIPSFLGRCDLAVLPSHSEGMSNALLEAMAAGRAIVATDVGANARLVRDRVDGLITADSRPDTLARSICELIANPRFARQLAVSAKERVRMEYDRSRMVQKFETFYERLVDMETIADQPWKSPIDSATATVR